MLLAVAEFPTHPEALERAAALCGLVRYDINQRLTGALPRVLMSAPADRIQTLSQALSPLGFVTFTCDPAAVPGEEECLVARTLLLGPRGLQVIDRAGATHDCPADAVALVQRGQRTVKITVVDKSTERQFSLERAVLTGGLMMSKKVDKLSTRETVASESFIAVQRGDGQPDVLLYERRMDYRFLGEQMGPASQGNLQRTEAWLRQLLPGVPFDDRIGRPGFVRGLPQTAADPVDLALHLVRLKYLQRSGAPG